MILATVCAAALLAGCGEDEEREGAAVAERVERQLRYLDPQSTVVATVDVRWESENWDHLRAVASRAFRAYRGAAGAEERAELPPNLTGALNMLASFAGLSFEKDIQPLLDGYAVIGVVQPPVPPLAEDVQAIQRKPFKDWTAEDERRVQEAQARQAALSDPRVTIVYRTGGDGLRDVVEKVTEGEKLKPVGEGGDALLIEEGLALVGDDTLVQVDGPDPSALLYHALKRGAVEGAGIPAARMEEAERQAAIDDPFVLVAAQREVARAVAEEPGLQRAFAEVPWLGAVRSIAGAAGLDEKGVDVSAVVATDPRALGDDDLPLAPAGDLDLPRADAITGASRDQSFTTTFLSRTARALFADSDFAKAVERAERDLGVSFEDEVLRQFSCPSMSTFEPRTQRFGARSCVRDPERMKELLPKLSEHLPRILTTLQRLETQGLVGLLLIAPDAPLTPSFTQLARIVVEPFKDGPPEETLYEVTGLRDEWGSTLAASGPERVVFGLIGETFVVASDKEMAREAAELEGERLDEPAASAIRVPIPALGLNTGDTAENALLAQLGELRLSAAADRAALKARGRLEFGE